MTHAPYTIDVDENARLVRLALFGLWDLETLDRYAKDVWQAFSRAEAAGIAPERFRVLIDLTQHGVQPREVAERIQRQLAVGISPASRHAVLVSESALHKIQAQRVGAHLSGVFFASREEDAMTWLLAADSAGPDR